MKKGYLLFFSFVIILFVFVSCNNEREKTIIIDTKPTINNSGVTVNEEKNKNNQQSVNYSVTPAGDIILGFENINKLKSALYNADSEEHRAIMNALNDENINNIKKFSIFTESFLSNENVLLIPAFEGKEATINPEVAEQGFGCMILSNNGFKSPSLWYYVIYQGKPYSIYVIYLDPDTGKKDMSSIEVLMGQLISGFPDVQLKKGSYLDAKKVKLELYDGYMTEAYRIVSKTGRVDYNLILNDHLIRVFPGPAGSDADEAFWKAFSVIEYSK